MKKNYIITDRPEDMDYEVYKALKNQQRKALQDYKQGKIYVNIKQNIKEDNENKEDK